MTQCHVPGVASPYAAGEASQTAVGVIHVPCHGAFCRYTSILAKHDHLRYFWLLRLVVRVILFPMTWYFFDDTILNLVKIGNNPLGYWIQGSAGSAGSWAFFLKFWLGK